ncbi:MAG TPA: MerR family transcriptional regulator [Bacteroidales bacterium]|nr:MerR family transcriptional regulator [Bacteroidales bacterium]HSA42957.1 MerR family transcriptional regulator [Bacteroidales bacterium]
MISTDLPPGKLYFTIGEVASIFQVNASLIRYWEKEFSSLSPAKNKKGNRLFTPQDIEQLAQIFHLVKEKGYTLQGARDFLKAQGKKPAGKDQVMASLLSIRKKVIDLKNTLEIY